MKYSRMSNQELEQLIEQKDLDAICEMAERCLNGTDGVEQNLNRAYQLFHRAEAQGSLRAYEGLGYMYEHGILFGQNLSLAKEYYEKAGITKTEFAKEKVRLTNQERVAAAIAKAEDIRVVKVSSAAEDDSDGALKEETTAEESEVSSKTNEQVTPAETTETTEQEAEAARLAYRAALEAAGKAQAAADKAKEAADLAQETAEAAAKAAEYAQKACQ